ncbi:DUF6338 family protein [Actinomadura napierensis]|uniref:Uncharacterized protein n=1 Tax=Actinomadura napierensis TaxID=267854 RepID=A0ABP5LY67_9ACTN
MPSTLTGLVMFIVLLLPGFAYLVGRERAGVERKPTALRELISIVSAGVVADLTVITVAWPLWSWALDENALFASPAKYWRMHPGLVSFWALALLVVATLGAFLATAEFSRQMVARIIGEYPHESTVSAWWRLFELWKPDLDKQVGCLLEDGSYVEGILASFNRAGDDLPDRDLILVEPILYRPPDGEQATPHPVGAVCVPARKIVLMTVNYLLAPGP